MAYAIRAAGVADVPTLLALIRELAEYERLGHAAIGTEELLRQGLFGAEPAAEAALAELVEGEDAMPVGFALWFTTFSTFLCRPGMWLEDIYVKPEHRRHGVGRHLLLHLVRVAAERGCGRLELAVLDWNSPAIAFYQSLGARALDDWTVQRLDGEVLRRLAGRAEL